MGKWAYVKNGSKLAIFNPDMGIMFTSINLTAIDDQNLMIPKDIYDFGDTNHTNHLVEGRSDEILAYLKLTF